MPTKELIPQIEVIIAAKRQYLLERKSKTPIEAIRALASMQKRPLPFLSSVTLNSPVLLIGQVRYSLRRTGPLQEEYDPVAAAVEQVRAGVDAVSLFTDDTLYQGGLDDLVLVSRAVSVPVISLDFIFDEYQVVEARAAGASAIVLYSAVLEPPLLRRLVSAIQRNRMTAIVEVHTEQELDFALSLSPYVIGLSSRDLRNRQSDMSVLRRLRSRIPVSTHVMMLDVAASVEEVQRAVSLGVDAVQATESVVRDPAQFPRLQPILRRPDSSDGNPRN